MTSRPTFLTIVVAAAALGFGSLAAVAAMPVPVTAQVNSASGIVQVQAPPAAATTDPAASEQKAAKKKSAKKKSETDQSIESGTVPKRYRSSVPKEYHHLIPFAK